MRTSGGLGPFDLVRRVLAARRGDVRAKEDLYHLRGVFRFVALFAATIGLPGALLAYYGIQGISAQQQAGAARVEQDAELAADAVGVQVEAVFRAFEDAALNRLKSGQSLHAGLGEMSDALRVVYRFDKDGSLAAPFVRDEAEGPDPERWRLSESWRAAATAEATGDFRKAAGLYRAFAERQSDPLARGDASFAEARALLRAGETRSADAALATVERAWSAARSPEGFRLGDLARLKRAEILLAHDSVAGEAALRALAESLLVEDWTLGQGGEPAVARRALDLVSSLAPRDVVARLRGRLEERAVQLYWAGELLDELDSLGAKGRLLRQEPGTFSYRATPSALWAMTWTDTDQYVFALERDALLGELRLLALRSVGNRGDVAVDIIDASDAPPTDVRVRRPFARAPSWSLVAYARNPVELKARQSDEVRQAIGIVAISVAMIVLGLLVSARLVRRELDAARLKSEFAANVSHELRSPITQIRLKAEALQLGLAETNEQRSRHYDVIVREAERLSRMVDNMLDFAAIERGQKRYNLRPGDLVVTVQNVVESARVAMEMRAKTIEENYPEDLPPVRHDADAVAQVLVNLLSNAAKYGGEAGWIGVTVRAAANEVLVEVSDCGIGIAPQELAAIFEQYYRSSDPNARRQKGTGIGLTIVKYIMEAHGGRVSLRSTLGVGTTFTLHFPQGD